MVFYCNYVLIIYCKFYSTLPATQAAGKWS